MFSSSPPRLGAYQPQQQQQQQQDWQQWRQHQRQKGHRVGSLLSLALSAAFLLLTVACNGVSAAYDLTVTTEFPKRLSFIEIQLAISGLNAAQHDEIKLEIFHVDNESAVPSIIPSTLQRCACISSSAPVSTIIGTPTTDAEVVTLRYSGVWIAPVTLVCSAVVSPFTSAMSVGGLAARLTWPNATVLNISSPAFTPANATIDFPHGGIFRYADRYQRKASTTMSMRFTFSSWLGVPGNAQPLLMIDTNPFFLFSGTPTCSLTLDSGLEVVLTRDGSSNGTLLVMNFAAPTDAVPGIGAMITCETPWRAVTETTSMTERAFSFALTLATGTRIADPVRTVIESMLNETITPTVAGNVSWTGTKFGVRGNTPSLLTLSLTDSNGLFYRGNPGSYCAIKAVPTATEPQALTVTWDGAAPLDSLFTTGQCVFRGETLSLHGTQLPNQYARARLMIYLPSPPSGITVNADGFFETDVDLIAPAVGTPSVSPSLLPPVSRARPIAATTFNWQGKFAAQRSFTITPEDKNSVPPRLASHTLQPFMALDSSPATPAPRVRPRTLHAIATSPAAAPVIGGVSPVTSGQLVFWFGGMAVTPDTSPADIPPLLSDLWMFDVVGNTTTLLHGDPGLENLPAGLPNNEESGLAIGQRYPMLRPAARHSAALAYDPVTRLLWLAGGATMPLSERKAIAELQAFFNDLWSFSLETRQWAWHHGVTYAKVRPATGGALTPFPPMAGASLAAYDNQLVLFGGLVMPTKMQHTGRNAYFEMDHVYDIRISGDSVDLYLRTNESVGYTIATAPEFAIPSVGRESHNGPGAMAYAAMSIELYNHQAGIFKAIVFGGARLPPAAVDGDIPYISNAADRRLDSSLHGGLWRLEIQNGILSWTWIDSPAVRGAANGRGIPRIALSQDAALEHPGGRVFHAMNVAPNGDIVVFGGRGHAAGYYITRAGLRPESLSLAQTVALAPFTLPIVGRFNAPTEQNAVGLHAFVYTEAELTTAGIDFNAPLNSLEVLLKLSRYSAVPEWYESASFRVHALLQFVDFSEINEAKHTPAWLETMAVAARAHGNAVTFNPNVWETDSFLSLSSATRDNGLPAATPVVGTRNLLLFLHIEYLFTFFSPDLNTFQQFAVDMEAQDANTSLSYIRGGVPVANTDVVGPWLRYQQRPVLLLRSRMPASLQTLPPVSRDIFGSPQLDDLWVFERSTAFWKLVYGFATPLARTALPLSNNASRALLASNPGHWLGARLQPVLAIPTTTDVAVDSKALVATLFIHGGYSLHPTWADDIRSMSAVATGEATALFEYNRYLGLDDLWSVDLVSICTDSTAPQAATCVGTSPRIMHTELEITPIPGSSLYTQYFAYPGAHNGALFETQGNMCPTTSSCNATTGTCVPGAGGYYCSCKPYRTGGTCSGAGETERRRVLTPAHATGISDTFLTHVQLPFSAVAVHPADGRVWTYGGIAVDGAMASSTVYSRLSSVSFALQNYREIETLSGVTDFIHFDSGMVPTLDGPKYFTAAQPPPSHDALAWFSVDGETLYVYMESFVAPPGIWAFAVANKTWQTAGPNHLLSDFPVSGAYSALHTGHGNFSANNHPGSRQHFGRAASATRACIYSGEQVNYPGRGDGINTDLWCVLNDNTPSSLQWALMSGYPDLPSGEYMPIFGAPGEFGALYNPGPRVGASLAFSADGGDEVLYLFGGSLYCSTGMTSIPRPAYMADLWVFDFFRNQWAYLSGPTTWATTVSAHRADRRETAGAPSRLQWPGARAAASMAAAADGLLYISDGVGLREDGLSAPLQSTFAVFARQLHDIFWQSNDYQWAPEHEEGTAVAAWIWIDELNNTREPAAFSWSNFVRSPILGGQMTFIPSSLASRDTGYARPASLMVRTTGLRQLSEPPMATEIYPFAATQSYTVHDMPISLGTDSCRNNPCANGGTCQLCRDLVNNCTGALDAGQGASFYACRCPAGYFGQHCELTRYTYAPPSAIRGIPCRNGALPNNVSISAPCACQTDATDPLCSPLRAAAIVQSNGSSILTASRIHTANAVAHGLSSIAAGMLGFPQNDTVLFGGGGAESINRHFLAGTIAAVSYATRAAVIVHQPPNGADSTSVFTGTAVSIGSYYGAALVFAPTVDRLFLHGGIYYTGELMMARDVYDRLWRLWPSQQSVAPQPEILTPAPARTTARIPPTLVGSVDVDNMTGHARRSDGVYPTGSPGARAFHSMAAITISGVEYVYLYGGMKPSVDGLQYLADIWRFRTRDSGSITWEYIGCAVTVPNFISLSSPLNTTKSLKDFCPSARARTQMLTVGTELWVIGGVGAAGALDDIWVFNAEFETWTLRAGSSVKSTGTVTAPNFATLPYTMGSRYGHSCDVLPTAGSAIVCYGGLTAQGASVDLFRRITPVMLSRSVYYPSAGALDVLPPFYPHDTDKAWLATEVPRELLTSVGLEDGLQLRSLTLYFALPVDAYFGAMFRVNARLAFVSDWVNDLYSVAATASTSMDTTPTSWATDGTTLTLTFSGTFAVMDAPHVSLVVIIETVPIAGSFNREREHLAWASPSENVANDQFVAFTSIRSRNTLVGGTNGKVWQTDLRPQLRFSVLPDASADGVAAANDMFSINTTTFGIAQLAGASTATSASLAGAKLAYGAGNSIARGDPVIESLEANRAVEWQGALLDLEAEDATESQFAMQMTPSALVGHLFAVLPTGAGLPQRYMTMGGYWTLEAPLDASDDWNGHHLLLNRNFPFSGGTDAFTVANKYLFYGGARGKYTAPAPPAQPFPMPTIARFTPSMSSVELLFEAPTQQPRSTTPASEANCNIVLSGFSNHSPGSGVQCAWSTPSTFTIMLGASFTVRAGDEVIIKGGVIRTGSTLAENATALYLPETHMIVMLPDTMTTPVPVVTGPARLGVCDALSLSSVASANSGGLAFAHTWHSDGDDFALQDYITRTYGLRDDGKPFLSDSSPYYIPTLSVPLGEDLNDILPPGGTVKFTLELQSWYGQTATTSITVSRAYSELPQIAIAGSKTLSVVPTRNVLVNALISRVSLCEGATVGTNISYIWTQVGETGVEFVGNLASLRVRAYAMPPRVAPYVFRVNVTDVTGNTPYTNSDEVSITVTASALRAVISGGGKVHSASKELVLSAALSRDPDVNPAGGTSQYDGLTYLWSCVDASNAAQPCFANGTFTNLSSVEVRFASSFLESADVLTTVMLFSVTVSKGSERAPVTVSARVDLTIDDPEYSVAVSSPGRSQILQQNPIVMTAVVARLSAGDPAATERYRPRVLWSCDTRNANLNEAGLILFQAASPASDGSGGLVYTLALSGEKLVPGVAYTFRLSLFPNNGTVLPTQAEIQDLPVAALPGELVSSYASFSINSPPRSGSCAPVFAANVTEARSNVPFTLRCSGWEDDVEDLPLTYHWYAESKRVLRGAVKSNWVEIGMALPQPSLEATLRAGHAVDGYARAIEVYITDIWGAQTRVEVEVPFEAPASADPAEGEITTGAVPKLFSTLAADGATAEDIEALFATLTDAVTVSDIAAVSQSTLRITDALEDAAVSVTAAGKTAFRARLLEAIRGVAEMLTISQDARRAAAALVDSEGSSAETEQDHNQFSQNAGYSEVAIELLTQLCADGTQLDRATRTQALHTLVVQTSSLASRDAFLGMSTATADSALVATQVVIDAFAAELAGRHRRLRRRARRAEPQHLAPRRGLRRRQHNGGRGAAGAEAGGRGRGQRGRADDERARDGIAGAAGRGPGPRDAGVRRTLSRLAGYRHARCA